MDKVSPRQANWIRDILTDAEIQCGGKFLSHCSKRCIEEVIGLASEGKIEEAKDAVLTARTLMQMHRAEASEVEAQFKAQTLVQFYEVARRGRSPAASNGEQRAYRLGLAVLKDGYGLDASIREGLSVLGEMVCADYSGTREYWSKRVGGRLPK